MKEITEEIATFLRERGWDKKLMPSDVAKSICIEAAELLELFQWNNLTTEETRKDAYRMEHLKKEVADVLIYTLYLPILLGLDAERLVRDKLRHNDEKYPAELMKQRGDEKHDDADPYIQIKKRYRAKGA